METRDPVGFHILEKGLRKILNTKYTLYLIYNDELDNRLESFIHFNEFNYDVEIFESQDSPSEHENYTFNEYLGKNINNKFIKIELLTENASKIVYQQPKNPEQLKFDNNLSFDRPLNDFTCNICLEPITQGFSMKCGHIFHCDCIINWKNTRMTNTYYEHGWHNECPVCRQPINKMIKVSVSAFGKRKINKLETKIKKINLILIYLLN